jgi:ABC-2 family transporter protein
MTNLMIARQMVRAEILKLRRNRAVMAFAALLSVVVVMLMFGFAAVEHASNPAQNGPAGGLEGFHRTLKLLGLLFGPLTAILIATEAGTADNASGVFRDLVATGRSRLALFLVRLPAAAAVSLAFIGAAYALALIGTFAFAGGTATPSVSLIVRSAVWIAAANAIIVSLAVGVGSLTGSRAVTLTAVIGWQAVATQALLNVTALGSARDALLTPSIGRLAPIDLRLDGVTMASGVAVVVVVLWAIVPAALGAWRTRVRDA